MVENSRKISDQQAVTLKGANSILGFIRIESKDKVDPQCQPPNKVSSNQRGQALKTEDLLSLDSSP